MYTTAWGAGPSASGRTARRRPVTVSGSIRNQRSRTPGAQVTSDSPAEPLGSEIDGVTDVSRQSLHEDTPSGVRFVVHVIALERNEA